MNKQYLNLTLESDTFRGMKADFDELMQQQLEKLFAGRIADGSISMKLSVSLTETYSETMGKDISVPLFKHKTTANYTEKLENAGAVSLPNTYLEYDEDLGKFVLKPCGGEQDMFAEQESEAEADEVTVDVKAIPQDCHRPLQVRDPMCNDCANRDTSACDHCDGCDKWLEDATGSVEITDKTSVEIAPLNHDWNAPAYTWNADNTVCTATRTCKRDAAHKKTATATVTSAQTKAPTCTAKGETTYTAAFTEAWANTQTKTVDNIAALGHDWSTAWTGDSTGHWHKCTRCDATTTKAAHDYGSDNVCDTCGYNKTVPHTHTLTLVAAKAATCTEGGKEAYYKCEGCGKFYEDVLGTKEITDLASWGNIAKIAHTTKQTVTKATPTANGKIVNYCSVCKKTLSTTVIPKASSIKLKATSLTYNGKVRTPKVIVKDRTGKTLVKNTDYTVSYAKGRKYVGKYAVKITFKGKYSGTKTLYFTIKPKATSISSLKAGSKKFTVKWKKQATQTTGYQVQYSASSKFSKAKTVTVGKNTTVSKKISKLSGKKKYYVRVRTYKTVKINGKSIRIYSGWSKAKTVTTKK